MRARRAVTIASSIVLLLLTAMACASDDPPAEQSAGTVRDRSGATTTTTTDPPPPVPHVAPTAIRELLVDPATLGTLYPLSATEVLSIDEYGPNPDGTRNPRLWILDVTTGAAKALDGPPFFAQAGGGRDFAVTPDGLYLASATCEDRAGECIAPRVEVVWWDVTTHEWTEVGNYDPSDLVGDHWADRVIGLHLATFEEGDDLPLALSDDSDNETENLGTRLVTIDPTTGEFERESPVELRRDPPQGCETPSGLAARLAQDGTVEPRRTPSNTAVTGTLEIEGPDGEWSEVAGLGPAAHLTCALDSIWVLADGQWLNVDGQGVVRSAQPIESPTEVDVALDVFTVVGAGTDDVALVRQLGTDQRADLELRADRLDVIVYTGPDRTPVSHKVPRGVRPPEGLGPFVGDYADALPLDVLQPYPRFALSLPGGRILIIPANGNPLQPLLVAE
jgi:hypothetical protein